MAYAEKKDLKLFYTIGEVAEMFDVKDTLLRFWEREFPQINPKKGGRGVRRYTKDDIEIIRVIYNLVKVRGLRSDAAREVNLWNLKPKWAQCDYGQTTHSLRLLRVWL